MTTRPTRYKSATCLLYVVVSVFALSPLGCPKPIHATRRVAIRMKKYSIEPAEVRLKLGETVEFHVSSEDVQHGFDVPSLGIKESVQPSHPAVFIYTADRPGEFEIKCGILCGSGHDRMKARLIVE